MGRDPYIGEHLKFAVISRIRTTIRVDIFKTKEEALEWAKWRLTCGFEVFGISEHVEGYDR